MRFHKFLLILISFLCLFLLTGCTMDGSGVETKAYVIAMGIDNR